MGKLEVIEPTKERKNGYTIWKCRCECGEEILVDTRTLQRSTIKDCGCVTSTHSRGYDLKGKRFTRLMAVKPLEKRKNGSVVWLCQCDCGKTAEITAKELVNGNKKSCGCLGKPPLKDYVGKRFGNLEVISYEEKREGKHYWRCLCDCGRETIVNQTSLQSGKTKSCGCLKAQSVRERLNLVDDTSVRILETVREKRMKTNSSGYTGVYQQKATGKWVAQITF